jgi:YD repeat-containing protein
VRELNDGAVQMYLRDPAGNLVEVNWPDAGTLDRSVVTDIVRIGDERPQSAEALRASLYPVRQVPA